MDVKPPPGGDFTVYSTLTPSPSAALVFTARRGSHLGPGPLRSLENALVTCVNAH